MVSLKNKQSGFTIVELLIVIVIIGILATLVIVTFAGVQQKARDSERKVDINATANVLEAFYANKGYYPPLADIMDGTASTGWRAVNKDDFKLDNKSLYDPKTVPSDQTTLDSTKGLVAAVTANRYAYAATKGAAACTTAGDQCDGYTLTATLENQTNGSTFVRKSQ